MNEPLNPYAPPKSKVDGADPELSAAGAHSFYAVGIRKYYLMYFCTFGLYAIYWMYRNWKAQKERAGADVWPVPRGLFLIFFLHSLFGRVEQKLTSGGQRFEGSANGLATGIVAIVICNAIFGQVALRAPVNLIWIVVVAIAAIVLQAPLFAKAQRNINAACGDPDGATNSGMTLANWTWAAICLAYNLWIWSFSLAAITKAQAGLG